MKQYSYRKWIVILLAVLLAACGGDGGEISFSTANIQNAVLAKDEAGEEKAAVFAPKDTIFLLADLQNAPDDTTVKSVWFALEVPGEDDDLYIDEAELTTGSSALTFRLPPDTSWPAGKYKVDLYLNGELDQTLTYEVEGPAPVADDAAPVEDTAADTGDVGDEVSPPPAEDGSTAVSTLEDVKKATVRIQAQGSFMDPEIGEALNVAGQGTGFIIDEAGIAVTNNHVVTGAAFLQVWIGDETEPRNAKILGVSECSDLAVIDIEGEGFHKLEWYEGDINVGLDIYVAGYPLFGNEEYSVTRGIVSKAAANGDSNWASIDAVIEIDATINGGNSGGPLVDKNGRVVGVNYAGRDDTHQFFSISRDVAMPVVAQLRAGEDVHSIGINGRAVTDGASIFGIWVSSVASGTPADEAGIQSGDILTQLEGLVLATDGTMASYCDILRGKDPDDVMSMQVLRLSTGEILEGQLNGRTLETVGVLGGEPTAANAGGAYTGYVTINDDSGQLAVNVPAEWGQVDGSAWVNSDSETLGISVVAAPDVNGFLTTWGTPGVAFRASSSLNVTDQELLDQLDFSGDCQFDGRELYSDQLYTGQYDIWSGCGGTGSTYVVLTAVPEDNAFVILLEVQLISDADGEAFQEILNSFVVQ